MWPVDDRFVASVSQSHDALGQLDFLIDGEPVLSSVVGDELDVLEIVDPGIRFEEATIAVAAGAVRRIVNNLTLYDDRRSLVPVVEKELLIVGQSEIRIWSGLRYADARTDEVGVVLVPVFTGPITGVDLEDYPYVKLQASDRMWYLLQEFTAPYSPVASATLDDSIESLLRFKIPTTKLAYNIPTTDVTTGVLTFDEQSVPADGLVKLATATGWTIYCDPMGTFQVESEPELRAQDVVMTYARGAALIKPKPRYNVQNVVNTWVVTGEASNLGQQGTPYAKVVDDDPNSPTYVRAPYDERPRFVSIPTCRTDAQCRVAATTLKKREVGLAFSIEADVFPNPALERGDVLRIDDDADVDQLVIADAFQVNVPALERQTITGRVGSVISDG